jgi:hypothetical protein
MKYKWCKTCQINYLRKNFTNWTSKNEKIDNFIRKRQLKISVPSNIVFEWISYDQFSNIEEVEEDEFPTVYSAKWKNGPLYWNKYRKKYLRLLNSKVFLKYLYNLQDIDEFLNEVKYVICN